MAEFVEVQDEVPNADNITQSTTEAPAEQAVNANPVTTESVVPEKYKGKTLDDVVKMHLEAEKLIGKQAQEVGEVRKLADELIKQQLNAKQDTQPSVKDNEIDFFEDPAKAVNQAVANNPVLRQIQEQQEAQMRQQAAVQLQSKFPDFQEIVASDDFANWIKSSRVRIDLFTRANNFDFDSAEELLETYTAIRGTKTKQADTDLITNDKSNRSQALKSAAVPKGGSGEVGKPVYRRVDLIRLRMQDPERYNAMQDEIMQAYSENRVK
jgi:hypothetical protein